MNQSTENCPVEAVVNMIGGRWKIIIISRLNRFGRRHFGELKKSIPQINERMLTRQLRELENDGLIFRDVFAEVPPRVEYGLSAEGKTLIPVLNLLAEWGSHHQETSKTKGRKMDVIN
ncbi:MAG: helix-turn-helix transcriptional regulator [Gammaproteobacteria bacterium]|nr:helix-turn-helix transcriptional regulator [Gammaproteobacteria bacterium]